MWLWRKPSACEAYRGKKRRFSYGYGRRVDFAYCFFPYPFDDTSWIKQFRVIQESRKRLIIQVVAKEVSTDYNRVIKDAENKIHRLFGCDMEVKFEFVEEIPRDPSGKLRKVISYI